MRALVLVLFASGCSLLFDGGDLHGARAHGSDLSMPIPHDMGGRVADLLGAPPPDMQHGLAFAAAASYVTGGATDLAFGHFTGGTLHPDAILVGHGANMVYVLGNQGDGTFKLASSHAGCFYGTQPGKPYNVVTGDFDGDTHDDVAFTCNDTSSGQDHVDVLLGDGAGGLGKTTATGFNAGAAHSATASGNVFNAVGLATGDFNSDGKRDLMVAYNQDDHTDLFAGLGGNPPTFASTSFALPANSQSASVLAADLNGDGASDAVLSNNMGAPVLVASKPFTTGFSLTTYFPSAMYPGGVGTAVFGALSAGGRPDLLVVIFDAVAMMPGNTIHVLRNDGDGNFPGTPQMIPADPSTSYITVADFDGDGRPDIAWVAADIGHVSVALQNADMTFKPAVHLTVPTGITGLQAVDVDGDGRMDLALPSATVRGLVVLLNRSF